MTALVMHDRERGGYIALGRVREGEIVTLAPISPPLRVQKDRRIRRLGFAAFVVVDLWLLAFELAAWVAFEACR